jgi:hypothetical protein
VGFELGASVGTVTDGDVGELFAVDEPGVKSQLWFAGRLWWSKKLTCLLRVFDLAPRDAEQGCFDYQLHQHLLTTGSQIKDLIVVPLPALVGWEVYVGLLKRPLLREWTSRRAESSGEYFLSGADS